MKYYNLTGGGLNIRETSVQFQSVDGIVGDIQKEFIPFEGKINFPFKLPEPFLEKKAKPTTYLNVVMIPSWFLVLKDYFVSFLKDFDIGEFQTWDIKVHKKELIIEDYKLFVLSYPLQRQVINFSDSDFFSGSFTDFNFIGETIAIKNHSDFIRVREELSKQNKTLKYRKVVFDLSGIKSDMFRIVNSPASGYYVSEKLKDSIEERHFTGMAFKEIVEVDSRIHVVY